MTALTAAQMTDIIFQKPGRVTEGLLATRTPLQKLRDEFSSCSLEGFPTGMLAKAWSKNRVVFYDSDWFGAAVREEHPRSFRSALKELKTFGFSIPQVRAINDKIIYKFWMFAFDDLRRIHKPFGDKIESQCKGQLVQLWASKAFLGVCLWSKEIRDQRELPNITFDKEAEDMTYEEILNHLAHQEREDPSFFIPAARTP